MKNAHFWATGAHYNVTYFEDAGYNGMYLWLSGEFFVLKWLV